jgi:hypothetical protein
MCSVIEIKNSDEYYIHYHSPESLEPSMEAAALAAAATADKNKKQQQLQEKAEEDNNKDCKIRQEQQQKKKVDATTTTTLAKKFIEDGASSLSEDGTSGHQSDKDYSVGEMMSSAPTAEFNGSEEGKGTHPKFMMQEVTSDRCSSLEGEDDSNTDQAKSKEDDLEDDEDKTGVSPLSSATSNLHHQSEVPITVNSHIPTSPVRPIMAAAFAAAAAKADTSDSSTQMVASAPDEELKKKKKVRLVENEEDLSVSKNNERLLRLANKAEKEEKKKHKEKRKEEKDKKREEKERSERKKEEEKRTREEKEKAERDKKAEAAENKKREEKKKREEEKARVKEAAKKLKEREKLEKQRTAVIAAATASDNSEKASSITTETLKAPLASPEEGDSSTKTKLVAKRLSPSKIPKPTKTEKKPSFIRKFGRGSSSEKSAAKKRSKSADNINALKESEAEESEAGGGGYVRRKSTASARSEVDLGSLTDSEAATNEKGTRKRWMLGGNGKINQNVPGDPKGSYLSETSLALDRLFVYPVQYGKRAVRSINLWGYSRLSHLRRAALDPS